MDKNSINEELSSMERLFGIPDRPMYFNRYGEPMTLDEWGRSYGHHERKVLRQTHVYGYMISTVWLGMDHNYFGGIPLIFETMVFAPERTAFLDLECRRYSTLTEAHLGHDEVVSMLLHLIGAEMREICLEYDSRPALSAASR